MQILLIEDDKETADFVTAGLHEVGHTVCVAATGEEGLIMAVSKPCDLIIVDRLLPNIDGLSVVLEFRKNDSCTPVLFLTAMNGIDDLVVGLNAGADDYLTKPFAITELAARVNALSRRPKDLKDITRFNLLDLEVNLITREVYRQKKKILLQRREFQILQMFIANSGRVVTKTMLLRDLWNFHFDPKTNIVESHISRLRGKIDKGHQPLIHTIRGVGYCLRDSDPSKIVDIKHHYNTWIRLP